MAKSVHVKLNNGGIRAIFTSSEMQGVLKAHAQDIADGASAKAKTHFQHHTFKDSDNYKSKVKVLRNTAIGVVYAPTFQSRIDQSLFHTLNSFNH